MSIFLNRKYIEDYASEVHPLGYLPLSVAFFGYEV